jgi:ribonuclease HII
MINNYSGNLMEAGADEAGRGCLTGPVVAAAVILPEGFSHPKLNDSKKMSAKSRDIVFEALMADKSVIYGIGIIYPEEIDAINILNASIKAMHNAIAGIANIPEFLIIDGNQFKPYKDRATGRIIPHACIVKGDSKYMSIAAASVLAKVTRDRHMDDLDKKFPGYGWAKNKGYCTKDHIEAIKKLGKNNEHFRKTFHVPGLATPIF